MPISGNYLNAPVGIGDIQQAIGLSSGDLKTLCSSDTIKKWTKYHPFRDATIGYGTAALNQAAAKAHDFGMVSKRSQFTISQLCSKSITALYNEAQDSRGEWIYLKPRGLAYGEAYRTGDFAWYNKAAEYPPMTITFTPDESDRTKATFKFLYPTSDAAHDMQIKDFPWYTAAVSSGTYAGSNWKYGILYSQYSYIQEGQVAAPTRLLGPDIYLPSGAYNTSKGSSDWTAISGGFQKVVTIQRGRRRFFVPFITRLPLSGTIYYSDSVFLPWGQADRYSLPQTVTTTNVTDMWFPTTPTIYSHTNWAELIDGDGGTITVNAELDGIILSYEKAQDRAVDISFRLASDYGDGNRVTAPVGTVFFCQSLNSSVTNYYNQANESSPGNEYHQRLTFTIDPAEATFLTYGTELYLQVYDHGTLLDEIYIDSVPSN